MVRAWRYADSFDPRRGSVAGWLLTIVRNVALDHLRAHGRRPERLTPDLPAVALIDEIDAADIAAQSDDVTHILDAMRALPAEQRHALLAVTVHGLSGAEYSRSANLPLGTVKTRIRLALRKLPRRAGSGCTMNVDCDRVDTLADDLALGFLTGAERALVLRHLDECHSCRIEVASLTQIAEAVLLLSPSAAPADGFDRRVLDGIRRAQGDVVEMPAAAPVRRRGRMRAIVSVAAAVVVLFFASTLWAGPRSAPTGIAAAMIDGRGDLVGQVSLIADGGTTVTMDLPGWDRLAARYGGPSEGQYRLRLDLDDGSRRTVALAAGEIGPEPLHTSIAPADIAGVAIADRDGRVWCQAHFV